MPYQTRKVKYCHVTVPSRPGTGTRILEPLKDAGVNLLAFTGFPVGGRKAQVDLVTDDIRGVQRVAKENGWRLSKVKKGFLVQGTDEIGSQGPVTTRRRGYQCDRCGCRSRRQGPVRHDLLGQSGQIQQGGAGAEGQIAARHFFGISDNGIRAGTGLVDDFRPE